MTVDLSKGSPPEQADAYQEELSRLFNLYRIANLNIRYYGARAEKFEGWLRWTLGLAALLSAAALALLLIADPSDKTVRFIAAGLAGFPAILSAVIPFWGWPEKARDMRNLRFSYAQLFGQLEFAITEIRRGGELTEQGIGLARMVHEAFMRVETMDEMEPDQALLDREDSKVRAAFPPDYLWSHF